jgi:hypothetical protein
MMVSPSLALKLRVFGLRRKRTASHSLKEPVSPPPGRLDRAPRRRSFDLFVSDLSVREVLSDNDGQLASRFPSVRPIENAAVQLTRRRTLSTSCGSRACPVHEMCNVADVANSRDEAK